MDRNEKEKIYAQKRDAARKALQQENKRPYIILGAVCGIIFSGILLAKEPGASLFEKVSLCVMFIWIFINMATYRGRYYPRSIYAVKICYPVFLFILLMLLTGRM